MSPFLSILYGATMWTLGAWVGWMVSHRRLTKGNTHAVQSVLVGGPMDGETISAFPTMHRAFVQVGGGPKHIYLRAPNDRFVFDKSQPAPPTGPGGMGDK